MATDVKDVEVPMELFEELGNIEKDMAGVELDAQFQSILTSEVDLEDSDSDSNVDLITIGAIRNLNVERYEIKNEQEGEPRSLRFTFEFDKNPIFEDTKVVKDFEWVTADGAGGGLVSKPVTFKWTKAGKKAMEEKSGGILDLAVELYQAEAAVQVKSSANGKGIDVVDREGLWQYEKLREKLAQMQDEDEEGEGKEGTWLDWFGYRGAVNLGVKNTAPGAAKEKKIKHAAPQTNGTGNPKEAKSADEDEDEFEGFEVDDSDDDEDGDEGLLDVEIFPAGEAVAHALADDLWPNVMEYFMAAQDPALDLDDDELEGLDELDDDDEEDEAPELVTAADAEADAAAEAGESTRPSKKQRKH